MVPTRFRTATVPTYLHYDSRADRLTICLDVAPADVEDVSVATGRNRAEITVERSGGVWERSFDPPTDEHVFEGNQRARYKNGILTVTLETTTG